MATFPRQRDAVWSASWRILTTLLGSTWLLVTTLSLSTVALVATALFLIPTPYQVLLPGPVTDVQRLIEPNPHPGKGALYLTTIYSDPASVGEWLYARINPEAGIVPREEARPRNVDDKQYQKLLVSMMDESKVAAKVVALREAGYDVTVTGQGAQVRELAETSKAEGAAPGRGRDRRRGRGAGRHVDRPDRPPAVPAPRGHGAPGGQARGVG